MRLRQRAASQQTSDIPSSSKSRKRTTTTTSKVEPKKSTRQPPTKKAGRKPKVIEEPEKEEPLILGAEEEEFEVWNDADTGLEIGDEEEVQVEEMISLPPSSDIPKTISSFTHGNTFKRAQSTATQEQEQQRSAFGTPAPEDDEEPSYLPDPTDPFGFLAAERKIKHRRHALKDVRDLNSSMKMSPYKKATLEWASEDEGDVSLAFATPKRRATLAASKRRSTQVSQSLVPLSRDRVSSPVKEAPLLKTADLERLLPRPKNKRKVARKGKENGSERTGQKKGRHAAKKTDDVDSEVEEEEIELDPAALKARKERKKCLDELKDYELATETVIWL